MNKKGALVMAETKKTPKIIEFFKSPDLLVWVIFIIMMVIGGKVVYM